MISITRAGRSDLPEILELQRLAFRSEAQRLGDFTIQPLRQTLEEIAAEFDEGVILRAITQDQLIGSVRAKRVGNTVLIGKLMVHPDYRRQGVGVRLLNAIETACPAQRYELFTSRTSENNLRLYRKQGYSVMQGKDSDFFVQLEKFGC